MPSRFISLLAAFAIVGCTGAKADQRPGAPGSNAIIIRNADIGGSALQALRTHIPSVRISTAPGQCPRIVFRGDLSAVNPNTPTVYVDRTLMADTCILNAILGQDIDYMEVYPSGNTSDPSLRRNPAGVIAIYRRRE